MSDRSPMFDLLRAVEIVCRAAVTNTPPTKLERLELAGIDPRFIRRRVRRWIGPAGEA